MNFRAFSVDAAFQITTWVAIGCCISSFFYFLGKRSKKGIRRSIIALIVCILIMIGLLAERYIIEARATRATAIVPEKQYVSIVASNLDALIVGTNPVLTLQLDNGRGDAPVVFKDVTCRFTSFVPEKYLKYDATGESRKFTLTPHQKMLARWEFGQCELTQEQIDALNAKPPTGELYFFAKGEWTDESGIKHQFPFCYRYTTTFPNHVEYCSEDIKLQ